MTLDYWYVLSVRSRHEKKIEKKINTLYKGVKAFCPTVNAANHDFIQATNIPFFKGLVFVKAIQSKLHSLFEIPGAKKFLNIKGDLVGVSDIDINIMSLLCEAEVKGSNTYHQISKKNKTKTKHDNNFIKKVFDNTIVLSHKFFNYTIEANLIV